MGLEPNQAVVRLATEELKAVVVVDLVVGELEAQGRRVVILHPQSPVGGLPAVEAAGGVLARESVEEPERGIHVGGDITQSGGPLVVPLLVGLNVEGLHLVGKDVADAAETILGGEERSTSPHVGVLAHRRVSCEDVEVVPVGIHVGEPAPAELRVLEPQGGEAQGLLTHADGCPQGAGGILNVLSATELLHPHAPALAITLDEVGEVGPDVGGEVDIDVGSVGVEVVILGRQQGLVGRSGAKRLVERIVQPEELAEELQAPGFARGDPGLEARRVVIVQNGIVQIHVVQAIVTIRSHFPGHVEADGPHAEVAIKAHRVQIGVEHQGIVVSVEAFLIPVVDVLTAHPHGEVPGKLHVDEHEIPPGARQVRVAHMTEPGGEGHVLIDVLLEGEASAVQAEASGVVGVKPLHAEAEIAVDLPPAEALLDDGEAAVDVVDLHAEGVELVFELHHELLQHLDILLAGLLHVDHGESPGDGGGHFVTGHGLVALEGGIGIAVDDAGGGELTDGIIGPVVHGHVHEGIGRDGRGGESQRHGDYQQSCKFLHSTNNPLVMIYVRPKRAFQGAHPSGGSLLVSFSSGHVRWPGDLWSAFPFPLPYWLGVAPPFSPSGVVGNAWKHCQGVRGTLKDPGQMVLQEMAESPWVLRPIFSFRRTKGPPRPPGRPHRRRLKGPRGGLRRGNPPRCGIGGAG
ncbi:MAG: hypothetical protein BWY88_00147 [Synergistetes bacterium ADurb.Bin520]|nr:MAG: hypothetical protein BWY88_00147 [Synergistetes bacterium ADurb.Bin520]